MSDLKLKTLDRVDKKILRELQMDGRLSITKLSQRVNLSATPCAERVKRLERDGFIQGYSARLDPRLLNMSLLVFVEISLIHTSPDVFASFRESVRQLPEVLECHLVTGNFDYLIKARVEDMKAYRTLLGETLLTLPEVSDSRTYVVMEEVKETAAIHF